jgi:hemolysin activation/secretion protein
MAALAAAATASAVHAQSDPASLERTVPKFETKKTENPSPVILPTVTQQREAQVAGTFVLGAVNIEGATVFSSAELAKSFEPYLASRVGQAELDKIVADITGRYRRAGYLLSYAVLPEQSVHSGIVTIRVIEGFIGAVRIEGDPRFAAAVKPIAARLQTERPLRGPTLERELTLIRDIPGLTLRDTKLSRSADEPARYELAIVLQSDRVSGILYADNRGMIDGARVRGYSSITVRSLVIPGDQAEADFFSIPSSDFRYLYGQVKDSFPLGPDGLRLTLSGSRGKQFQRLTGSDEHGTSDQWTADLSYPFKRRRSIAVIGHVSLSDWTSEETLGGARIQRDRFQVVRAWLELTRFSTSQIDARLGISQGFDARGDTKSGDPLASRPFGGAKFTKLNADFSFTTPLSDRARLRLDSSAQYSTRPLLASEEFALGGARIGRAFDFNAVTGDHGIGVMAELSYRLGDVQGGPKGVEVFTYAEAGAVFRRRPSPGLADDQWLSDSGAGLRFTEFQMIWSAEVGIPITPIQPRDEVRAFFSVARGF